MSVIAKPDNQRERSIGKPWLLVALLMSCVAFAAITLVSQVALGSFSATLHFLSGDRLLLDPAAHYVGNVPPGHLTTSKFTLWNLSTQTESLAGYRSSCACVTIDNLPAELAPGERRLFTIQVQGPTPANGTMIYVNLYCNLQLRRRLGLSIYTEGINSLKGTK